MTTRTSFLVALTVGLAALLSKPAVLPAEEPAPDVEVAPPPATQPAAEREPGASVEVLSVQITRPMSPDLTRALAGARGAGRWTGDGTPAAVELVFAVRIPDRTLLHVFPATAEAEPFQVATFTDDKDNDLARRKEPRRVPGSSYSCVTQDGKAIVVAVASATPVGEGASKVTLRGSLTVRTNTGDKTSDRQPLALRGGKAVDIGGIPLGVRKLIRSKDGMRLTLSAPESLERVKSLRFFTPEGEEIPARMLGRAENRPPHHSEIGYQLPAGVDEVEVEATYMGAIETVTVPVEVEAKLGASADEVMVKLSDE